MIAVGLESTFYLLIFRAAMLVPPHPGGVGRKAVLTASLLGALASRGEEKGSLFHDPPF